VIEKLGFNDKVKVSVVIGLFTGNMITLERAAELSSRSLSDFIDLLQSQGIPWMQYTEEEKRQDDISSKEIDVWAGRLIQGLRSEPKRMPNIIKGFLNKFFLYSLL
jgi:predicted HTH domain antitoxin